MCNLFPGLKKRRNIFMGQRSGSVLVTSIPSELRNTVIISRMISEFCAVCQNWEILTFTSDLLSFRLSQYIKLAFPQTTQPLESDQGVALNPVDKNSFDFWQKFSSDLAVFFLIPQQLWVDLSSLLFWHIIFKGLVFLFRKA